MRTCFFFLNVDGQGTQAIIKNLNKRNQRGSEIKVLLK